MSLPSRSVDRHMALTVGMIAITLAVAGLAVLPSVLPGKLGFLNRIEVDTDPENMLSSDEPVRVFHDEMKKRLALHDMIVVGVVNESHPAGVFNPQSLAKVQALTRFAETLHGSQIGEADGVGVIRKDLIAPGTVDTIEPTSAGVSFSWLMREPPATQAQADEIRRQAMRIPFLHDTLVSHDGKALALYVPISRKDLSYKISQRLQEEIDRLGGPEEFHITGLPVAEDTFGVEMFIQMAISAPAAMAVILVLMLLFFRKLVVVIAPMVVALVSVVLTMGLLVISGFPIHIMSSMIPIFIMPIAVLDSIHIISEFFERYQATRDRRTTVLHVMDELWSPMLYTSLTSAAGFASLALTPIPPVQVFGAFVASGVMIAWILTVTFVPASVMFIAPRRLENFGARHVDGEAEGRTWLGRFLRGVGGATYRRAKGILVVTAVLAAVAFYGITKIQVNDNPIKWFTRSHPIRVADEVLNRHFGGTYMAYLALSPQKEFDAKAHAGQFAQVLRSRGAELGADNPAAAAVFNELAELAPKGAQQALEQAGGHRTFPVRDRYFQILMDRVDQARSNQSAPSAPAPAPSEGPAAPAGLPEGLGGDVSPPAGLPGAADSPAPPAGLPGGDVALPPGLAQPATAPAADKSAAQRRRAWDAAADLIWSERQKGEIFKRPEVLRYMDQLQEAAASSGIVGKSNSLSDIVKTVHRDFRGGDQHHYVVPERSDAVAQMLIQYQSSHRKDDLWHFVTPDYRSASSIWMQLRSGDNRDMSKVVAAVDAFTVRTPPPADLKVEWFGLTYINVVWQERMVIGMMESFAGSFLVVLLMMIIMFRSALWGLLSMIPLTVTIAAIYGAIGLLGVDYDMPVAVLSSLTLGLAVDFAIHFLARGRELHRRFGSWKEAAPAVFGEPARAITRNIIVIAAGFLPLLLAPLVPYKTVGVLLATILLVSGVATLMLLPALVRVLERRLFKPPAKVASVPCNCGTCLASAVVLVLVLAVNLYQFFRIPLATLSILSLVAVPILAVACGMMSRRRACQLQQAPPAAEVPQENTNNPEVKS